MPRRFLRKYLPNVETIRNNRFLSRFGAVLLHHDLWHLHRHSTAKGVAIGLFCGLIPGPLQMISAAILCLLCRANLPVALVTTLYTNPLTIVPLYLLAYRLGLVFFPDSDVSPSLQTLEVASWLDYLPALIDWTLSLGKPLALGLPLLALILAAVGWGLVHLGWRLYVVLAWRQRARNRKTKR